MFSIVSHRAERAECVENVSQMFPRQLFKYLIYSDLRQFIAAAQAAVE